MMQICLYVFASVYVCVYVYVLYMCVCVCLCVYVCVRAELPRVTALTAARRCLHAASLCRFLSSPPHASGATGVEWDSVLAVSSGLASFTPHNNNIMCSREYGISTAG